MKKANLFGRRLLSSLLICALALLMGANALCIDARAESGDVYTCEIVRCYRHPVTGEIEDSGGESSYATGLGMVEGAVYDYGIMEVTSDGGYYLTFKMSLVDYCSDHAFLVQNTGDSSWSSPGEVGVTSTGTDTNGTTYNICVKVPSENCIVRFTMYVEPMGRNVVGYFYPTNYSSGNSTSDMTPAVVSSSGSDSGGTSSDSGSTSSDSGSTSSDSGSTSSDSGSTSSDSGSSSSASSGTSSGTASGTVSSSSSLSSSSDSGSSSADETADTIETESETSDDGGEETIDSIIDLGAGSTDDETAAAEEISDDELSSAQGLSLSTEGESVDENSSSGVTANHYLRVLFNTLCVVIVILVIAFIVYIFRKNWYKWGRKDLYEDDDDQE